MDLLEIISGAIITTVVGAFIVNLIRKGFKGDKPKVLFRYHVRDGLVSGSYPREYKFDAWLQIKNIDTEPIYKLRVESKNNGKKEDVVSYTDLRVGDKEERLNREVVHFGNEGLDRVGARGMLPDAFATPNYTLYFEDKDGHKHKQKVEVLT